MSNDIDNASNTPNPTDRRRGLLTPGRAAILVAIVACVVYVVTMNRTFGFVDKGEMVAVASTLGIAHPTGYPTIMLLGYAFKSIVPLRPVLALNLMSALLTAAGAGMMVLLLYDILGRVGAGLASTQRSRAGEPANEKKKGARKAQTNGDRSGAVAAVASDRWNRAADSDRVRLLYAVLGGLFTAFTATWWNQGNGFEVYSLHALMLPLVALLFLRVVDEEYANPRLQERYAGSIVAGWIRPTQRAALFGIMVGLSFTNHLTTVLLAPAFLVYYFWAEGGRGRRVWAIGSLALPFLVGLAPYLWLPIRSSMQPRFNWGAPTLVKNFVDHVTGKIYRVYMFDSWDTFWQQTGFFFHHLPRELAYGGLLFALIGLVVLLERRPRLGVMIILLFVTCVIWSGFYDIMEIGPYFMTAIFAVCIMCTVGMVWLHERLGARAPAVVLVPVALVVAALAVNYRQSDESGNTIVQDMCMNVMANLPKDAVVFSGQWDFWVSGSFYMQEVEKYRPDVLVIDPELLRRVWYIDDLTRAYPEFMRRVQPEVDTFRRAVYDFDHDLPYDGAKIQAAYIGMMNAMIDRWIGERPICVTGDVVPEVGARYQRIPNYMTLRLMPGDQYLAQEFPAYTFSFWEGRVDSYAAKAYELYGRAAYARALYERQHNRSDLAGRYLDLALSFDPGFDPDQVPELQLNAEDQVYGMMDFFSHVRAVRSSAAAQSRR